MEKEILESSQFLVDVQVSDSGSGMGKVTVLADADGGLSIDACASISRQLGAALEEVVPEDQPYRLEVSSPGADQPLQLPRQYINSIGRQVHLTLTDGKELKGLLKEAGEEAVVLSPKKEKSKKKEVAEDLCIPYSAISSTKIIISFK